MSSKRRWEILATAAAALGFLWVLFWTWTFFRSFTLQLYLGAIPVVLTAVAVATRRGKSSVAVKGVSALVLYLWTFLTFIWHFAIGAHLMLVATVLAVLAALPRPKSDSSRE